jgi:peptide/nickel transport system ATP-binding protein
MADPVLDVKNLRIETNAGAEIVSGISFAVRRGEVFGLVGESGSGKTSTALALLGHARRGTRLTAGSVRVENSDLLALPPAALRKIRGARIAYVPQDATAGLNPRHRIGRQVEEVLIAHGKPISAVESLVVRVHLPSDSNFLRRYPFELSGGQQQRVAIAMALSCQPAVLVLDEPTTGLDASTQAHILALLRELGSQTGAAFVYVSHDLAVVSQFAHRVGVMYAGRLVEVGGRAGVFGTPGHPYTSLLLASVPRLSQARALTGISGSAPPPGQRPNGCSFAPRCPAAIPRCVDEFPLEAARGDQVVYCWRAWEFAANAVDKPGASTAAVAPAELLTAEAISASYRHSGRRFQVLSDVSFSVKAGGCLAIVGESGSGKTTLGRCIAGLHRPDGGTVRLGGRSLAAHVTNRTSSARREMQIVFQDPERSLNPRQAVQEIIGRPLRFFGFARDGATEREQVAHLLERVRLPLEMFDRYPRELSGGEKQRVAIARALAARPSLLVCDEITSSLDVSIQAAIMAVLEDLRRDGLALLFITHNIALIRSIAESVLVLERGTVREYGRTDDVLGRPAHPYTRELVASIPDLGRLDSMDTPRAARLAGTTG